MLRDRFYNKLCYYNDDKMFAKHFMTCGHRYIFLIVGRKSPTFYYLAWTSY